MYLQAHFPVAAFPKLFLSPSLLIQFSNKLFTAHNSILLSTLYIEQASMYLKIEDDN